MMNDLGDARKILETSIERLFGIALDWKRRALVAEDRLASPFKAGVERARDIVKARIKNARDSQSDPTRIATLEEANVYLTAEIDRLGAER